MVKIYTGTMRYGGPSRMDITVKGGSVFGPVWNMVMGYKDGSISEEVYTEMYYDLMRTLYIDDKAAFQNVCDMEEVTFCCYCPAGAFCHRYLLADMFTKLGAEYMGER